MSIVIGWGHLLFEWGIKSLILPKCPRLPLPLPTLRWLLDAELGVCFQMWCFPAQPHLHPATRFPTCRETYQSIQHPNMLSPALGWEIVPAGRLTAFITPKLEFGNYYPTSSSQSACGLLQVTSYHSRYEWGEFKMTTCVNYSNSGRCHLQFLIESLKHSTQLTCHGIDLLTMNYSYVLQASLFCLSFDSRGCASPLPKRQMPRGRLLGLDCEGSFESAPRKTISIIDPPAIRTYLYCRTQNSNGCFLKQHLNIPHSSRDKSMKN